MRSQICFLLMAGLSVGWTQDCSDDPLQQGSIKVSVVDETLVIANFYRQPVSYFAVESGVAELINWVRHFR